MAEIDRDALLARFSRGTLSEAERRALYQAALDDQALFDTLAEEDALRELLDHADTGPAVGPRLAPPRRTASGARFRLPLAIAASLAVVSLGTLLLWRTQPLDMLQVARDTPEAQALWSDSETTTKGLAPLPVRVVLAAGSAGPGRFQPGEAMRLEISSPAELRVAILVRVPAGPRLLVPKADAVLPVVRPSAPLVVSTDDGLRAPRQPGRYQLRVVAARAEGVADLASLRGRLGEGIVADVDFDVVP